MYDLRNQFCSFIAKRVTPAWLWRNDEVTPCLEAAPGGLCDIGSRDRIYKWRRDKLVLSYLLKSGFAPDSDEVAAVTSQR